MAIKYSPGCGCCESCDSADLFPASDFDLLGESDPVQEAADIASGRLRDGRTFVSTNEVLLLGRSEWESTTKPTKQLTTLTTHIVSCLRKVARNKVIAEPTYPTHQLVVYV